jgi:hypothetical protein
MPFLGKRNLSMKKHEKGHRIHIPNSKKSLGSISNTQLRHPCHIKPMTKAIKPLNH